ncbi:MAG: NADP-dependent oxidoreductase [Parvularcula sp.]|nr:NADP-dependent oxidoreductase [Parvularcula sp.]
MKLVTPKAPIAHKPRADDFGVIEKDAPSCPEGSVLIEVIYASLDPYIGSMLRGRHMGEEPPAPMAEPVPSAILGVVSESRADGLRPGAIVTTMSGAWQEVIAARPADLRVIERNDLPLAAYLSVLGMPGLTAWAGVTRLARVTAGDTFLVDAAAGPVGGTAGQIARICGAERVVGIAGGEDKCRIVTEEYGFDACIDYRRDGWRDRLAEALPDGLTVFFENVSAEMAMQALSLAKPYARGILCGLVDAYHDESRSQHPINAGLMIGKRAQLSGLVVYDFYPQWDEFLGEAQVWLRDGRLRPHHDIADGIDALPAQFEKLMDGQNRGKALVRFKEEPSR